MSSVIRSIGGYADWLPIAYDFEFLQQDTGEPLGINRRRRWKFRDIYDIDLTADTERFLDRRLGSRPPSAWTPCRRAEPRHRSSTRSSRGCEQQISALPSAGGSTGSGR